MLGEKGKVCLLCCVLEEKGRSGERKGSPFSCQTSPLTYPFQVVSVCPSSKEEGTEATARITRALRRGGQCQRGPAPSPEAGDPPPHIHSEMGVGSGWELSCQLLGSL